VLFLLGILSRATTVLFIIKQVTAQVARLASGLMTEARRLDFRHRRERRASARKRLIGRARKKDDEPFIIGSIAWA